MDPTEEKEGGGQTTSMQCGEREGCSMWLFSRLVPQGHVLGSKIVKAGEMR